MLTSKTGVSPDPFPPEESDERSGSSGSTGGRHGILEHRNSSNIETFAVVFTPSLL